MWKKQASHRDAYACLQIDNLGLLLDKELPDPDEERVGRVQDEDPGIVGGELLPHEAGEVAAGVEGCQAMWNLTWGEVDLLREGIW